MKHRNVLGVIFYSIITLGIYDLFWLAKTKKVLNRDTKVHTPSLWLLFAPPLILVAVVLIFVTVLGVHQSATTSNTFNDQSGFSSTSTSSTGLGYSVTVIIIYVLGILAIIPITFYWFLKFSKAVSEYTNGELSTAVNFLLLYLLRFVGIAVIQDKFNDMAERGTTDSVASAPSNAQLPPTPTEPAPISSEQPPVSTPTPTEDPAEQPPSNPQAPSGPVVG